MQRPIPSYCCGPGPTGRNPRREPNCLRRHRGRATTSGHSFLLPLPGFRDARRAVHHLADQRGSAKHGAFDVRWGSSRRGGRGPCAVRVRSACSACVRMPQKKEICAVHRSRSGADSPHVNAAFCGAMRLSWRMNAICLDLPRGHERIWITQPKFRFLHLYV